MKIEEARVRTARITTAGGREIRVGRWPGSNGGEGHVVLRVTWPEAPPGGRSEDSVRLPAEALPELREALDALAEGAP